MAKKAHVKISDLRGFTRLIAQAAVGITNLVEAMHRRVVHPPHLPSTPIQTLITDISGLVYKQVRFGTELVGNGLDKALAQLPPMMGEGEFSEERAIVMSTLNGIIGDYLAENSNPLAIQMQFRHKGQTIPLTPAGIQSVYGEAVNGKILVLAHGLCMNDVQWKRKGHDHGEALAQSLGFTPIYLFYNTGRHISINGQELSEQLEELTKNWPVPIASLSIVAHSMGGLVSRSAFHYGAGKTWPKLLKKLVFLGTPHNGAPLERVGNYVDLVLEAAAYLKPFARLGKIRSSGITDLRHGNLLDTDWQGFDRFEHRADQRTHVPLPATVDCYVAAGITGIEGNALAEHLVGDGLVYLDSAFGKHQEPSKHLKFKEQWVAYQCNHLDLLNKPEVYKKVEGWLRDFSS